MGEERQHQQVLLTSSHKLICFEGEAKTTKVRSAMKWWWLKCISMITTKTANVAFKAASARMRMSEQCIIIAMYYVFYGELRRFHNATLCYEKEETETGEESEKAKDKRATLDDIVFNFNADLLYIIYYI